MITVRDARPEDAGELLDIYEYYVLNTAISFEITVPTEDEFRSRIESVMSRYPYIVIECDGRIEGYAYAHAFIDREAYLHSCETTIYLRPGSRRMGLGRKIYEALEDELRKMGIINLYACIGLPDEDDEYLTSNSRDFHEHLGYRQVGVFRNCGRKFGRWYSMVWMEKFIGEHSDKPYQIKLKNHDEV